MVDKIEKALKKLTEKQKKKYKAILFKVIKGEFGGLDIKKLKGRNNIYRVRSGQMRITYQMRKDGSTKVLEFVRRSDNTYK